MRIALFECEEWEREHFARHLAGEELLFVDGTLTPETASQAKDAECVVVFIYSHVTREVLDGLPALRLLCTRSTGFDHIDRDAARERGVTVCSVPHYGENTVAEHTFALLLALSRRIVPSVSRVRGGSFEAAGLRGFDLQGKTIGVVGTGRIGQHVIRIARGFGMRVLGYDPFPRPELEAQLGFAYASLDDLLAQSDVVSLHCPYNEHTRHLLNEDNLQRIKRGAVLLNTARGGIVDSEALLRALHDGRIAAAGLDVLEEECHIREEREILTAAFRASCDLHKMVLEHVLIHHPNVIVTPHNAFNSQEALQRILDTTIENVRAWKDGSSQNVVS